MATGQHIVVFTKQATHRGPQTQGREHIARDELLDRGFRFSTVEGERAPGGHADQHQIRLSGRERDVRAVRRIVEVVAVVRAAVDSMYRTHDEEKLRRVSDVEWTPQDGVHQTVCRKRGAHREPE